MYGMHLHVLKLIQIPTTINILYSDRWSFAWLMANEMIQHWPQVSLSWPKSLSAGVHGWAGMVGPEKIEDNEGITMMMPPSEPCGADRRSDLATCWSSSWLSIRILMRYSLVPDFLPHCPSLDHPGRGQRRTHSPCCQVEGDISLWKCLKSARIGTPWGHGRRYSFLW